jgi:hypothetical protein
MVDHRLEEGPLVFNHLVLGPEDPVVEEMAETFGVFGCDAEDLISHLLQAFQVAAVGHQVEQETL